MKKLILICLIAVMLAGCDEVDRIYDIDNGTSMFVLIENGESWKVVYHRETKVMYTMSDGTGSRGVFTVMVDADGKPLLYEEAESEE